MNKNIKYAFVSYLLGLSSLTAKTSTRIYSRRLDVSRGKPAIAVTKQAEVRAGSHSGENDVVRTVLALTIIADTDYEVEEIKDIIISAINEEVITMDTLIVDCELTNDYDLEDETVIDLEEAVGVLEFTINWEK
jgi:hypothetical protein